MASETHTESESLKDKATGIISEAPKKAKSFQQFFKKFGNDWATTFAGALAYSLLTAMLPIAIALVAILGFVLTLIPGQQHSTAILSALKAIPGLQSVQQDLVQSVTDRLAKSAGFLAIIAVLLAVFGGSRLFVAIEGSLDIVYRVRPRTFVKKNLIAIMMMLIFTVLVPIMVFAAALPATILHIVSQNPSMKAIPFLSTVAANGFIIQLGGYAGGLVSAFLLFEAIYVIVPNQRINPRNSWQGAIVAAILLEIFISLFPLYTSNLLGTYQGQIGLAIVLLAFFYYFAVILMLGAEVNAFFFENVRPLPNDLGTFVSTMGGKLNQDRPDAEADSHINSKPTEQADYAHIAHTRHEEEKNQRKNLEKQERIMRPQIQQDQKQRKEKEKKTQSGKMATTIGVVAGSVLTVLIEGLRIRRGGK
ncbi:hypothetical protein KDW_56280 [Dictyobacter vulcani]|uniref:YihY/virulence factor BrkB family protein n=1 Tax=Dictyobacter vulcani TaxID=2607529 RepID=A0A5J4L1Z4_9CHLR|nr:YihY/virulence factor BrkB family protein [Dictyobacter vulcani]GER91466.1 hypothetical protein KDW_56280 [Dictyobacter vulcani]